jgi:hypothetical protein
VYFANGQIDRTLGPYSLTIIWTKTIYIDINMPEGSVTRSKNPHWHGDRGARVAIRRRPVDLSAEDKNDKKHREGAPTTTEVVWHPSGGDGYSLEWVAGSHQVRTK